MYKYKKKECTLKKFCFLSASKFYRIIIEKIVQDSDIHWLSWPGSHALDNNFVFNYIEWYSRLTTNIAVWYSKFWTKPSIYSLVSRSAAGLQVLLSATIFGLTEVPAWKLWRLFWLTESVVCCWCSSPLRCFCIYIFLILICHKPELVPALLQP